MADEKHFMSIKKGERILVTMLSEPLQEEWDRILAMREEIEPLCDQVQEQVQSIDDIEKLPDELAQQTLELHFKIKIATDTFWYNVNKQYNLWKYPHIAMRKGYCIVKCVDKMQKLKTLLDTLKDVIEDEE